MYSAPVALHTTEVCTNFSRHPVLKSCARKGSCVWSCSANILCFSCTAKTFYSPEPRISARVKSEVLPEDAQTLNLLYVLKEQTNKQKKNPKNFNSPFSSAPAPSPRHWRAFASASSRLVVRRISGKNAVRAPHRTRSVVFPSRPEQSDYTGKTQLTGRQCCTSAKRSAYAERKSHDMRNRGDKPSVLVLGAHTRAEGFVIFQVVPTTRSQTNCIDTHTQNSTWTKKKKKHVTEIYVTILLMCS